MRVQIFKRKEGQRAVLYTNCRTKKEAQKELSTKWLNIIEKDDCLTEQDGLFLDRTLLRYDVHSYFIVKDQTL